MCRQWYCRHTVAGWELPPLRLKCRVGRVAPVTDETSAASPDQPFDAAGFDPEQLDQEQLDALAEAEQAMADARARLGEVPAEVVVTNHVMGLYELAAIHLSATPPNLEPAALAIDAVACLVDGLGDRLGEEAGTMRDALNNIRLAFVQVKGVVGSDDTT